MGLARWVGRAVGLDVHREFCEVAICEDGEVRSAGRVPSTPEGIEDAGGESAGDRPGGVGGDGQLLGGRADPRAAREPRGRGVSPDDTGIAQARAKTDKLDARALASLLWRGELEAVWMPDERCRILRRRLARREQLVHVAARGLRTRSTRALQRRLQGKPPCSDLFGVKGRAVARERWSCRWRSASRSTPGSATSSSSTSRSRRWRG